MKELLLMNPIFNPIDAIKSGSIEDLNEIVMTNGQNTISNIDSINFHAHYNSGVATRRINAKTTENRANLRII